MKTVEEISLLSKIERLSGYLARMAAIDELGAKLRVKGEDEDWTEEEQNAWDELCDEADPWFYALSDAEKELLKPIENFMACLCRGEDPEEHIKLTYEFLPGGKYSSFPLT
jgi:hypothetical protein